MSQLHDPEWVAFEKTIGERPALPEDVDERIKMFNAMLANMAASLPATDKGITTHEVEVNDVVKARVYTPPGTKGKKPLPIVVFFHGGGWQAGNLDTEDHTCRTICAGLGSIIVSCDYRKGPVFKFPVPIDDAYDGYKWAIENATSLGADPERCIVSGGSAGGGLAIAVVHRAIKQEIADPAGLVVMQPFSLHPDAAPAEYKHLHTAYTENVNAAVVDGNSAMLAFQVLGALPPYQDPSWFPQTLGKAGVEGFPPTYIVNTDLECFRDDGGVLEVELTDAGVKVKRDVIKGFPHYFWSFPIVEGGRMFREMLIEGFKWVMGQA